MNESLLTHLCLYVSDSVCARMIVCASVTYATCTLYVRAFVRTSFADFVYSVFNHVLHNVQMVELWNNTHLNTFSSYTLLSFLLRCFLIYNHFLK